jgi:predicted 3-demethylubiquinone-9 3-methyltransferase (glyoxalase superfamily)/uncharacterized protein YndB with AHSA1/START domain
MNIQRRRFAPCLWFDSEAEEAARFYTSVFPNSSIGRISRYGREGHEIHGRPAGSVMTVDFELDGQHFTALNGGPVFTFNEAISLQVFCATQEEVDVLWERLTAGGDEAAQQCGWLKDRYGVSWQVIPEGVDELVGDPDSEKSQRAIAALLRMKKLDIEALRRAYEGEPRLHRLHFSIEIDAPRNTVYSTMLDDAAYRDWSAAFSPGSRFQGDWSEGSRIRFVDSAAEGERGMLSQVRVNRPGEYLELEHLGLVGDGREDTTSEAARAWAGAHESYTFTEADGKTVLAVEVDTVSEYREAFGEMWPRALDRLKALAEKGAAV